MLPDGVLSTTPVPSTFIWGRENLITGTLDYENGGLDIGDTTEALTYQTWRGRLIGEDVILDAPSVSPVTIYSAADITEISFSFDQNMTPALAYVQGGVAKLRWYDTSIPGYDILTVTGAITPRISIDDKRKSQTSQSDLILAYVRSNCLYYRRQRDRFLTEYLLLTGPALGIDSLQLVKIGMNKKWRFQFLFYVEPSGSGTGRHMIWVCM